MRRREALVLYEVDLLLFGAKTCSACGRELAANSDYFGRDAGKLDGLTHDCRDCKNARSADGARRRREHRRQQQREYRASKKALR